MKVLFLLITIILVGCSNGSSPGIFLKGGNPITEPTPSPNPETNPEQNEAVEIADVSLDDISGDLVGQGKSTNVDITNNTNDIIDVVFEIPQEPFFLNFGTCPEKLAPSESCSLELVFLPLDNLAYNVTIVIMGQDIPLSAKAEFPDIATASLVCSHELISFDGANGLPIGTDCNVNTVIDVEGNQVNEYTVESKAFVNGEQIASWQTNNDERFTVLKTDSSSTILVTSTITSSTGTSYVTSKAIGVVGNSIIAYREQEDNIHLYQRYLKQDESIPRDFDRWDRHFAGFSQIRFHDNVLFGIERNFMNNFVPTGINPISRYNPECMVGIEDYLLVAPCTKKTVDSLEYASPIIIKSNKVATSQGNYSQIQFDTISDNSQVPSFESTLNGQALMGAASFYDNKNDSLHIFGGSYLEDIQSNGNLVIKPNLKNIRYNNISNLNNTVTVEEANYTYSDNYPMLKSYARGVNKSYAFGGMGLVLQGESEHQSFTNELIKFENSDITLVETSNKPSKRYLAGMFFEETLNKIYLFGGLDENSNQLNDVWMLNLNLEDLVWEKIGDGYNFTHSFSLVDRLVSTFGLPLEDASFENIRDEYVSIPEYRSFIEGAKQLGAAYYRKVIYLNDLEGMPIGRISTYDNTILSTGNINIWSGADMYFNPNNFRHYKITDTSDNEAKIEIKDSLASEFIVYRASIRLEENTINNIQSIKPVVVSKAYNYNPLIGTSRGDIASLVFNFNTNAWEVFGYTSLTTPSSTSPMHTEVKNNPSDYISPEGAVEILIYPYYYTQYGAYYNMLEIDYIALEGVF